MNTYRSCLFVVAIGLSLLGCQEKKAVPIVSEMQVVELRCEHRTEPLGIGSVHPHLSWILQSEQRGRKQTAYQILVASSPERLAEDRADLWDSGKIDSHQTSAIAYNGSPLKSNMDCFWKVRVWDEDGHASAWSRSAYWSMGLLQSQDWKAEWIGYDVEPSVVAEAKADTEKTKQTIVSPARYLRKSFELGSPKIKKARLYATSLGIYQVFLNGQRVSEDYFSPGWTDYNKRIYYRTYDVKDKIQQGDNAIGAVLADGWFAGYVGGGHKRNHYGRNLRLLCQLNIEYEDGTTDVIASGPDWKASTGPILQADFLMGETYDARKEMPGWNRAAFDDMDWKPVVVGSDEVQPKVQAAIAQPVIAFETLNPLSVAETASGKYIFNMGQNFAGVVQVTVKGKPGQIITLRHGERLNPDGTLYTANLRLAKATDTYICKGGEKETWQPYFTFHGFQYVELAGVDAKPELDAIVGLALSSATPGTGTFECSDAMVNKLQSNSVWTQRANFIDIPTDCPQRNERMGWTGDAQVYINTACYQNHVQAFFTKWLIDLEDAQRPDGQFPKIAPMKGGGDDGGPAWADAGVICPWTIYKMYDDEQVLHTHYDAMKKFIAFCRDRSTEEMLPPEKFHCFGDWLNINDNTPKDVIYTAYFAYSTHLMAQIADVLNKPDDHVQYTQLFEKIKSSFNNAYVQPDGKIKGDTQAAYVLALAMDLLDGDKQQMAANHLIRRIEECNWHLSTGFVGTKDLMLVLAKIGRNDVAYQLLHNDTFPSWGFTIKNGATSIWERWNGWTPEAGFYNPGMNSFSHYSFGAVCQWMFENIGGIQTDGAGFKHILLKPQPGGKLTWAQTTYDSVRGKIQTDWKIKDGIFYCKVTIPPNTTATLYLPAATPESVTESGNPLQKATGIVKTSTEPHLIVIELYSGQYYFESKMPYNMIMCSSQACVGQSKIW